jgi:hypothetical protein
LAAWSVAIAHCQTQPIKNAFVSPIASIERWNCSGSGTGNITKPDGTVTGTYQWDCNGLQAIRLILVDGTVLGPYVTVPVAPAALGNGVWSRIPLATPDTRSALPVKK